MTEHEVKTTASGIQQKGARTMCPICKAWIKNKYMETHLEKRNHGST